VPLKRLSRTTKRGSGELRIALNKAVATLRKRLRAAIGDLGAVLENDSPLRNAFGLNEPVRSSKQDVAKASKKAAIKLRKGAETLGEERREVSSEERRTRRLTPMPRQRRR